MKRTIKYIMAALAGMALLATTAQAADVLRDVQPLVAISGMTLAAQGNTNYNVVMDCRGGKEVFIEVSYNLKTNYANNSTFPTTDTNVWVYFRKGINSTSGVKWGENSENRAHTPLPLTLKIPGCGTNSTFFATTNITLNATPYLLLWYATNGVAVDANCQVTNLTVKYWVK